MMMCYACNLSQESYVWGMYQQRIWDFFPVGECFRKQYEEELTRTWRTGTLWNNPEGQDDENNLENIASSLWLCITTLIDILAYHQLFKVCSR